MPRVCYICSLAEAPLCGPEDVDALSVRCANFCPFSWDRQISTPHAQAQAQIARPSSAGTSPTAARIFLVMALKRALTAFRLNPIVRGVESEQPEQRRTDRANTYQAQARHPNLSPTGAASSSSPRAGDRPVTRATVGTAMESTQVRTPGRPIFIFSKNFPIFPYSNFFLSMQSSL